MVPYIITCLIFVIQSVNSAPWDSMKTHHPIGDLKSDDTRNICLLVGGMNYFIIRKQMSWVEAVDACDLFCSKLATFPIVELAKKITKALFEIYNDKPELPANYFTSKNIYEFGRDRRYWIGLSDLGLEGTWMWSRTDNLTLTYDDLWFTNQPDHIRNKEANTVRSLEHCVALWNPLFHKGQQHTFNDESCISEYYALCDPPDPQRIKDDNVDKTNMLCTRIEQKESKCHQLDNAPDPSAVIEQENKMGIKRVNQRKRDYEKDKHNTSSMMLFQEK